MTLKVPTVQFFCAGLSGRYVPVFEMLLSKKILKKGEACCLRPILIQYFLDILLPSHKARYQNEKNADAVSSKVQ